MKKKRCLAPDWRFSVQHYFIADITYGMLGMVIMIWVMVVKMIAALILIVIKNIMVCDDGHDVGKRMSFDDDEPLTSEPPKRIAVTMAVSTAATMIASVTKVMRGKSNTWRLLRALHKGREIWTESLFGGSGTPPVEI